MTRNLLYFLFCILPFLGIAQDRQMTPAEISAFQKSLQGLAELKTLEADFNQYKYMSFMKKTIEASGKLYIRQPDRLSWFYTAPFQYKMVFKDNKIFINDQGKKSSLNLGNNKQFEKISRLIASGIRGGRYDEKEFTVSYFKQDGLNLVKLLPKANDAKKYIKEIRLLFSKSDNQVQEVMLMEPSNDYTRFVLKNKKKTTTLHDSVFNL